MAPVLRTVMLGDARGEVLFGGEEPQQRGQRACANGFPPEPATSLKKGSGQDQTDMLEHNLYQRSSLTRTVR